MFHCYYNFAEYFLMTYCQLLCVEFIGMCVYRVRWKVCVLRSVVSVCTEVGGKYVLRSVVSVCTEVGGKCMY